MPLTSPGVDDGVEPWDNLDRYRWNRTVTNHFVHGSKSDPTTTDCFYPCFGTSWPLRSNSEIYVVDWSVGYLIETNVGLGALVTAYVLVSVFTASSLTIASLVDIPSIPKNWRPLDIPSSIENIRRTWSATEMHLWDKMWRSCLRLWIPYNLVVARVLSPIVIATFIITIEWVIWNADPGGESFEHVGQWGVLVGAVLVLLAATVPWLVSRLFGSRFMGAYVWPVLKRIPFVRRHLLTLRKFREPDLGPIQRRRSF